MSVATAAGVVVVVVDVCLVVEPKLRPPPLLLSMFVSAFLYYESSNKWNKKIFPQAMCR